MIDLGKYAGVVTSAYGVSLLALAILVAFYVVRNANVKRQLSEAEARTHA